MNIDKIITDLKHLHGKVGNQFQEGDIIATSSGSLDISRQVCQELNKIIKELEA